ncbi:hypothetical protein LK533_10215 [Sphingomonas sp. PL-96]|uniref:hypothetical protein n=1 Tax=Sphingomonas sp. PL-96 TaxID=2887201 RepID=UPI001E57819A|nr:hypothetical protein [Sphingomonas sp. PL-96]MCC2977045.1 hypothetical protein [Sphingomonas sp. PL-96]
MGHQQLRRICRLSLPLLLLSTSHSAQAQAVAPQMPVTPAASGEEDIVVRGMNRKERDKAIAGYVDALTEMNPADPIALYEPGIYCPAAFGLSDTRNEEVVARMWRAAEIAGVRPAARPCIASAFVFFVDDIAAFLDLLKAQQPIFFGDLLDKEPRADGGPVLAWQLKRDFDPQHMPLAARRFGPRVVASPVGGSRILSMITRAVAASVVIIERKALLRQSATQIADYAMMRTVVDGDLRTTVANSQSILRVLDAPASSRPPTSLTRWDLAYLKGRYKGDLRVYGLRRAAAIRSALKRELDQSEPADQSAP